MRSSASCSFNDEIAPSQQGELIIRERPLFILPYQGSLLLLSTMDVLNIRDRISDFIPYGPHFISPPTAHTLRIQPILQPLLCEIPFQS